MFCWILVFVVFYYEVWFWKCVAFDMFRVVKRELGNTRPSCCFLFTSMGPCWIIPQGWRLKRKLSQQLMSCKYFVRYYQPLFWIHLWFLCYAVSVYIENHVIYSMTRTIKFIQWLVLNCKCFDCRKLFPLQLCDGLQHMHSLEPPYAHNDVKPGNVLLTRRTGQPPLAILMDFGSARPARKQIRSRQEALQLQVLRPSLVHTTLRSCNYSMSY